jgi:uncharacterized protein YqhQ
MARVAAATQLLPVMEGGEELLVGGQAVLEGIMMRSPHAYCISIRKPDGGIALHEEVISRPSERHKIFKVPVFRGLGTLGQAMTLGIKSLKFSTDTLLAEEAKPGEAAAPAKKPEISPWLMTLNIVFSLGFFIAFYKFLPLVLTNALKARMPLVGNHFVFNLVDGIIRIALFVAFLLVLSRWKDIHRMFEYHGAEHKTVFNFESRKPVTVENARTFITLHPRCGTSFMIVIMMLSIVFYTLIPYDGFVARLVTRIVLLPVIVGVSYELIRFAARHQGTLWATMVAPGLWLQKITTQEPADDQLEIAIHALDHAMNLEKQNGGELVIS